MTGPESCGKTTLANALRDTLQAPLVPEVSRDYLDQKIAADGNFRYSESDLLTIAEQQLAAERQALAGTPGILVCDTDLLVILIWSEVRFGHCHPWVQESFMESTERGRRHYMLCDHNIPWVPDPLRESADSRPELFELYRQKLEFFGLPYTIVSGNRESRLSTALEKVKS